MDESMNNTCNWTQFSYKELCNMVGDTYDPDWEVETQSIFDPYGLVYDGLCILTANLNMLTASVTSKYLEMNVWYVVHRIDTGEQILVNLEQDNGVVTVDGQKLIYTSDQYR